MQYNSILNQTKALFDLATIFAYCSSAMADAMLTSRAVFRSRASELMLEPGAVDKAVEEGIGSMGQFGFACRFVPGLLTALKYL